MKNKLSTKLSILLLALMPQIVFASSYSYSTEDFTPTMITFAFTTVFYIAAVFLPLCKMINNGGLKGALFIILSFARILLGLLCYAVFGTMFLVIDIVILLVLSLIIAIISSEVAKKQAADKEANVQQLLSNAQTTGSVPVAVGGSVLTAAPTLAEGVIDTSKCIECGTPVTVYDCFCPNCHTINNEFLKSGIFYTCNACFAPVKPDQAFCTACGASTSGFGKISHYYSIETKPLLFKPYKCSKCNNMIDDLVHECCECHTINKNYKGPVPRTICSKCGTKINDSQEFCTGCGGKASEVKTTYGDYLIQKKYVTPSEVGTTYFMTDSDYLGYYITQQFKKYSIRETGELPRKVVRRKKILKSLLAALMVIFTILVFFHRHIALYIALLAAMIILFIYTKGFTIKKFIMKEITSRPNEKMSNIILGVKNDLVKDNSNVVLIVGLVLAIFIPAVLFFNPRAIYEPNGDGLALRFYTYGIVGNSKAVIPAEVDGKKVTSIRGDVFANLYLLQEVELPETVEEIRGGAFSNDIMLKKVTLPSKITEIKGNTFENCISLRSIKIPDSVTRIGGHAFYGDSSLSEVIFTKDSKLQEIGSSAFRKCDSLMTITIPYGVYVNDRAFKESPTAIYFFESTDNTEDNTSNNYTIPYEQQ